MTKPFDMETWKLVQTAKLEGFILGRGGNEVHQILFTELNRMHHRRCKDGHGWAKT